MSRHVQKAHLTLEVFCFVAAHSSSCIKTCTKICVTLQFCSFSLFRLIVLSHAARWVPKKPPPANKFIPDPNNPREMYLRQSAQLFYQVGNSKTKKARPNQFENSVSQNLCIKTYAYNYVRVYIYVLYVLCRCVSCFYV